MPVPVTALYGALNAIFNIALANNVSLKRVQHKISVGTAGNEKLELAVRMHGNNAEFVPLAVVMLLVAELSGGSNLWLHVLGGSLLVARILHVLGLPRPAPNPPRFLGTAVTWVMIVATSLYVLALRYGLAGSA
jgi:uncharacterized protein